MKISTTAARELRESGRLDAGYFLSGAGTIRSAIQSMSGIQLRPVADFGSAYAPSRFKRTYAVDGEQFVPYLRPYDVFEFLPPEADRLSATRTDGLDNYLIRQGDILQTCSGRNLGPATIADAYLTRFALSHDMIRVRVDGLDERYYLLAFLRSNAGQLLLRGDRGGSVISHITTNHVEALKVPFVESIQAKVVALVDQATSMRETAREALHEAVESTNAAFPAVPATLHSGWTTSSSQLLDRFDAAFHAEPVRTQRSSLLTRGGIRLGDVADVVKPSGRTKMVYVNAGHGEPFLSGRQILQCDLVAPKYLARNSKQNAGGFALEQDTVIFQADGRAEEGLGYPAYVTQDRQGWLASGHVGRVVPFNSDDAGWIWASMASDIVRSQVVSLSCGSVVDALYPADIVGVMLPPRDAVDSQAVKAAWHKMADGSLLLQQASDLIDDALGTKKNS